MEGFPVRVAENEVRGPLRPIGTTSPSPAAAAADSEAAPSLIFVQNWHQGLLERVPVP